LDPEETAKVPGKQSRHAFELVEAIWSFEVPTGHFTQDVRPTSSWYVPASQGLQGALPEDEWNPAGQCVEFRGCSSGLQSVIAVEPTPDRVLLGHRLQESSDAPPMESL